MLVNFKQVVLHDNDRRDEIACFEVHEGIERRRQTSPHRNNTKDLVPEGGPVKRAGRPVHTGCDHRMDRVIHGELYTLVTIAMYAAMIKLLRLESGDLYTERGTQVVQRNLRLAEGEDNELHRQLACNLMGEYIAERLLQLCALCKWQLVTRSPTLHDYQVGP